MSGFFRPEKKIEARWKHTMQDGIISSLENLSVTRTRNLIQRDQSFEGNQSFPKIKSSKKLNVHNVSMDRLQGDGLQSVSFSSTPKRGSFINQLPVCVSTSKDDNWISATQSVYSAFNESNFLCINPNKAVFTVQLPTTEILIVNSKACQLLSYSSAELCSMRLDELLVEHHKKHIGALCKITESGEPDFENGKVVEMLTKDKKVVAVSMFIKKVNSLERCLAIAEPVERRFAQLSVDKSGKILSCDEEAATIFQYEQSDLFGVDIQVLIPSINFLKGCEVLPKEMRKQKTTGKANDGSIFPLCLSIIKFIFNVESPNQEYYQIKLWVYSNLSGLLVLSQDLQILNCNHYFTKILFGHPKTQLLNEKVYRIIPNFCEDVEVTGDRTMATYDSDISSSDSEVNLLDDETKKPDDLADVVKQGYPDKVDNVINFKTWESNMPNEIDASKLNCDTKSAEIYDITNCITDDVNAVNRDFKCTHSKQSTKDEHIVKADIENAVKVRDGTFVGFGRHIDGSNIDIIYHVKTVALNESISYLVWISRDPWETVIGSVPRTNLTFTSSFNSTSMDGSFVREASGRTNRPSSDSIISQCDEVLTAGDYSEHYTNLEQIGKGAFGYVKMAFRNSDGFLVITKFIKKQKINVKSWVIDPQLNMKVPLEISLLTTLNHPNIVKVVDVFHNESFFQLVMEKHGAGLDLFEFIDRKPKTDEKLNSYIFRQIVSAVHYLHSLDILHRDIKDENVIINEKFQVKLIDFGSATFRAPDRMFSTFYGTLEYCSPEVLQGNKYNGPELEIWALGVTLFVLTFGENPFYGVEETIKAKFIFPKAVSSTLSELISSMLDKDVKQRCDLNQLISHPWILQSVDVDSYKFETVVKCFHDEAHPPKYISEYCRSYDYDLPNELEHDVDDDRTVASSNSFCSLNTIENLDYVDESIDCLDESSTPSKCILNSELKLTTPPIVVLSSTPVASKLDKKTKSASLKFKTSENLTTDVRFRRSRNINSKEKRLSLDPTILNSFYKNVNLKHLCDSKSCDRFDELSNSSNELFFKSGENDLEREIFEELQKLKLAENRNNNSDKVSDRDEQAGVSEFYDAEENKFVDAEYESYWDAEDEKYMGDDSVS